MLSTIPRRRTLFLSGWVLAGALGVLGQEPSAPPTTGWVCGVVLEENGAIMAEADLELWPAAAPGAGEPKPVATDKSDAHGGFCFRDLDPAFYLLRVSKPRWPLQPPRTVEIRAGLLNRLDPIEMELEPGEPRVRYSESFDGMSFGQARAVAERLLEAGDAESIREVARRLLPKRGVRTDIGKVVWGYDPKPLSEELMRQVERGGLPPLKTARYLFAIGELTDQRTLDLVVPLLISRMRDSRRLPPDPTAGEEAAPVYVGEVASDALGRLAKKDFKWKPGAPPLQNQSAISAAQGWWTSELERRRRNRGE
jgi:hypothetical protein